MIKVKEGELEQLIQLARDKSVASRRTLAASVADLFFAEGQVLSDQERFLMIEIMRQLVKEVEVSIRRELAERLADQPGAPAGLIVELAHDTIEVAFPILRRSEVLQDEELVEIIKHRTIEHQLAIAKRNRLSGIVSQALVDGGAVDVIRTLLENHGAEIAADTIAYLAEQSKRVDTFQNPLLHRRELTPETAEQMYWWVSAALREHIVQRFAIDAARLDRAIEASVAAVGATEAAADRPASALARRLDDEAKITPRLLIEVLGEGEVALFRALFARMTRLRPRLADRLIFERGGEGMAIACKAIGLTRADFIALFTGTRKTPATVDDQAHRAAAFFDGLDDEASRHVLTNWQRNPGYQRAIWELEPPPSALMRA